MGSAYPSGAILFFLEFYLVLAAAPTAAPTTAAPGGWYGGGGSHGGSPEAARTASFSSSSFSIFTFSKVVFAVPMQRWREWGYCSSSGLRHKCTGPLSRCTVDAQDALLLRPFLPRGACGRPPTAAAPTAAPTATSYGGGSHTARSYGGSHGKLLRQLLQRLPRQAPTAAPTAAPSLLGDDVSLGHHHRQFSGPYCLAGVALQPPVAGTPARRGADTTGCVGPSVSRCVCNARLRLPVRAQCSG